MSFACNDDYLESMLEWLKGQDQSTHAVFRLTPGHLDLYLKDAVLMKTTSDMITVRIDIIRILVKTHKVNLNGGSLLLDLLRNKRIIPSFVFLQALIDLGMDVHEGLTFVEDRIKSLNPKSRAGKCFVRPWTRVKDLFENAEMRRKRFASIGLSLHPRCGKHSIFSKTTRTMREPQIWRFILKFAIK